jgi:membrane associated rhomboid family serine protease
MFGNDYSEDQRPITYLGSLPIYATTLLILIYVASMIGCALLLSSGQEELLRQLMYSSTDVLRQGKVWQCVTYVLVNPPSIPFAIDMLMLWWFGRPLEQFFGRRVFLRFYVLLLLFIPVVFTALALFGRPMSIAGVPGQLAIFVAFATLYPNAALLFNILAKWAAAAIVALQSLIHLSANDWPQLLALWLTCGFAYLFVRRERGELSLPSMATLRSRSKLRVLPPPAPSRRVAEESDAATEMDALLDKIAKSGMGSLTARERTRLDRAREALLKRDQP